jgi:hypothetical protein
MAFSPSAHSSTPNELHHRSLHRLDNGLRESSFLRSNASDTACPDEVIELPG